MLNIISSIKRRNTHIFAFLFFGTISLLTDVYEFVDLRNKCSIPHPAFIARNNPEWYEKHKHLSWQDRKNKAIEDFSNGKITYDTSILNDKEYKWIDSIQFGK